MCVEFLPNREAKGVNSGILQAVLIKTARMLDWSTGWVIASVPKEACTVNCAELKQLKTTNRLEDNGSAVWVWYPLT